MSFYRTCQPVHPTKKHGQFWEVVMAVTKATCWSDVARGSLAALVLVGAGFAADPAGADIIKGEDTLRGITMTRAQCGAIAQALWLNVYGQEFCVRYYLSTAGGEGSRPVVFWNGDSNGPLDITQDNRSGKIIRRAWHDPSKAFDVDTDAFVAMADRLSKMAKTTAIYIGRIGAEGTSGNHMSRKTVLELQLMNAALDAIKQRYGVEGFHLAGQSGGSRLVFGLAAVRHDVGCAVSGSGQLGTENGSSERGDPGQTYFKIDVPALARNLAVREMMITDPNDQQVPAATQQNPVALKLRQAGGLVEQYFVQSNAANHHDVTEYTRLVVAGCVLGKSSADIARAATTIDRRNAEMNQSREDKAKAKAKAKTKATVAFSTTARQPSFDPSLTAAGAIR
jgi:hypothetical protein